VIWLYTLRYDSIGVHRFFWGCNLFRVVCSPKQCGHHSLPPLRNCNNRGDRDKLPDLWPPNSPDLNPVDYKIWDIIQQRVQSTKVQGVKDIMMQHLIDAWAGVEASVIQDVIHHRCRRLHNCIQQQEDVININCDKN